MVKIAICGDKKILMDELSGYVQSYEKDLIELYKFHNSIDLLNEFKQDYKIIFLDIGSGAEDRKNDILMADKVMVQYPLCLIMYVTAYENCCTDLVHDELFLKRPFGEDKVHRIIENVIKKIRMEKANKKWEEGMEQQYVLVHGRLNKKRRINLFDISHFYSDYISCNAVMEDKTVHSFYKSLDDVYNEIEKYSIFIRINEGTIVNYYQIDQITPKELIMYNSSQFTISEEFRNSAHDAYDYLLKHSKGEKL